MTETDSNAKDGPKDKKKMSLSRPGKLELKKTVETGQVKQSFSHGRSKMVTVEVRKKRTFAPGEGGRMAKVDEAALAASAPEPEAETEAAAPAPDDAAAASVAAGAQAKAAAGAQAKADTLTDGEKAARAKALEEARKAAVEAEKRAKDEEKEAAARAVREAEEAEQRAKDEAKEAERRAAEEAEALKQQEEENRLAAELAAQKAEEPGKAVKPAPKAKDVDEARSAPKKAKTKVEAKPVARGRDGDRRRSSGKLTIASALSGGEERMRSEAARKRRREKAKKQQQQHLQDGQKILRDVIIPDTITVQELANRMAERGAMVVKTLMGMGVMATITQTIDADTAELVVAEFGHNVKRVSDSDVELGLSGGDDSETDLIPRAPVVTVMGHVDHGKTSLLDALRTTDVAGGEAGGITQHIGAYQITLESGSKITFIDTPGHAAFTEMRARGAKVTDIVVLVVAADDGIMPQTIEAIHHAKAADVPLIVAINKMDKPDADPTRIRTDLLQHEVVLEEMGGDILAVEVSAKSGMGLDKLEEAILLQAELLDLKSNPNRAAEGVIVEAKMERGRGAVATVLVQRGSLHIGNIVVAGSEWGRVRALVDDHGNAAAGAGPGQPVEVLGLSGVPAAGDEVVVVDSEARAREVSEFRQRKDRDARAAASSRGTLEQMFDKIKDGEAEAMPVLVKADVHGSVEAITQALNKMATEEVKVAILHAGVGGINESDVTLARASNALIIGFNVRANPQARDLARRDGVDIRYYSIIYDVTDDIKQALSGMLSPTLKENFLGYAEIREVFNVSKVGKIAGCMITDGVVKRGSKVRLLRDDVVIHEGDLSQLKRFKDDAKEVKEGMECGMAFANYQDLQVGDVIECFEVEEVAREL